MQDKLVGAAQESHEELEELVTAQNSVEKQRWTVNRTKNCDELGNGCESLRAIIEVVRRNATTAKTDD